MSVVAIWTFTESTGKKWTVEAAEIPPTGEHASVVKHMHRYNKSFRFKPPYILHIYTNDSFHDEQASNGNKVVVSYFINFVHVGQTNYYQFLKFP